MQRECEGAVRKKKREIGARAKERGTERGGDREREGWQGEREKERAGLRDGLKEREGGGALSHGCIGGLIRLPL